MTQPVETKLPTDRTFTSQLVAWCRDHEMYAEAEDIGKKCWFLTCPRKLLKRRMWICSVVNCQQAYRDKEEEENHACFSAY